MRTDTQIKYIEGESGSAYKYSAYVHQEQLVEYIACDKYRHSEPWHKNRGASSQIQIHTCRHALSMVMIGGGMAGDAGTLYFPERMPSGPESCTIQS